jgi:hypothetical protein
MRKSCTVDAMKIFTSVMLTATVSPSAATGTVTFYSGTTSVGSAALSNARQR